MAQSGMPAAIDAEVGKPYGTRQDLAEALSFAAAGEAMPAIEPHPLSSIDRIFERLELGDSKSRVDFEPENWSVS